MKDKQVELTGNVLAILTKEDGTQFRYVGKNIVTNDGDTFYAQSATTKAVAIDFTDTTAGIHLGSGTTGGGDKDDTDVVTACTGTAARKALQAGYPIAGDTEANNTGATTDAITWYYYWTATEGGVSKVNEGAIVNSLTGATKALCHFDFGTTFDKTTSDTLQVFVNHTFNGV